MDGRCAFDIAGKFISPMIHAAMARKGAVKTSRNRGFELVEAESQKEAREKFEDTTVSRRIDKVEEADLADYEAREPGE